MCVYPCASECECNSVCDKCVCTLWLPGGEKLPSFLHSKVREIMAFLSPFKNDLSFHSSFSLSTVGGGGGNGEDGGLTSLIKSRLACTFGRHQLWGTKSRRTRRSSERNAAADVLMWGIKRGEKNCVFNDGLHR